MIFLGLVGLIAVFAWLWYDNNKQVAQFEEAREKSLFQKVDEQLLAVKTVVEQEYSPPTIVPVEKPVRRPRKSHPTKAPAKRGRKKKE